MRISGALFTNAEMSASVADNTFPALPGGNPLISNNTIVDVIQAQNTLYIANLNGANNRCPSYDELQNVDSVIVQYISGSGVNATILAVNNIPGFSLPYKMHGGDIVTGSYIPFASASIKVLLSGINLTGSFITLNTPQSSYAISLLSGNVSGTYAFPYVSGNIAGPINITLQPGSTSDLSVFLSRTSTTLTANVAGGTPPYTYAFHCSPTGMPCSAYTIASPNQTISPPSASTGYTVTPYNAATYSFYCVVTDSAALSGTSNSVFLSPCLVPNTKITMADGSVKELKYIKKGDLLLDIEGLTKVLAVEELTVSKLYIINKGLLMTSPGHINVLKNKGLTSSEDLNWGDILYNHTEEIEITDIKTFIGSFPVINITTSTGTFIANGVFTHNKISC